MDASSPPAAGRTRPDPLGGPPARAVLVSAAVVVVLAVVAERFVRETSWLRLLDNVHWTVSEGAAAVLAWLGVRAAGPAERRPRTAMAMGLSAYAFGQLLWDVQVASGWNPFPAPSDALFLLLGPACAWAFVAELRARAPHGLRAQLALDASGLSVAAFALALALYLPLRGQHSWLQMAVLLAYPAGLLTAACIGIALVPALRLRRAPGWALLTASLFAHGALWMGWNQQTLSNTLRDGSLFNAGFSVAALMSGVGAMLWRAEPLRSPRWERRYEAIQRLLPIVFALGVSVAVIGAFTLPGLSELVQFTTLVCAAIVVALVVLRQSVQLHERDQLIEAERHFKTLFESARDAILLMDSRRFIECNPAAEQLFGLPRARLCGSSPVEFSPATQPDGRPSTDAARELIAAALSGRAQFFRWRHQRANGEPFDAEVSLNLVPLPGGRFLQAVVRDVTERVQAEATQRRLEEQLRHTSRLEAVGRLAGGVAHDFNNVLTVILGTTEIALTRVRDERLRRDLEEIRSSSRRAAALTGQLLAFSRKQVIAPVPSDLNALVSNALVMLRRLIGEDVELVFEPGAELGTILVDPTQLEQVLVNLAVNARDAMPGGGRLHIATATAELDDAACGSRPDARPGRFARLTVSDDGPGIAPEVIGHVFEPFFTTKEFGRGTGLGLSTVYGIVRQSDGFIDVTSVPGGGARFEIHFPLVAAALGIATPPRPEPSPGGRERVLLVEDEASVRMLARRVLEGLGYTVHAEPSGEAALRWAADPKHAIDLLLTDVVMPGMNGRQLYEQLLGSHPGLRVVYMSGYTDNIVAPLGVREPGSRFVQKPFSLDGLASEVRAALDAPPTGRAAA